MTDKTQYMEDRANQKWGSRHPMSWPVPPRKMPGWFNFIARIKIIEMEDAFGHIDQGALDRFWSEVDKGQSVYEDAGGYIFRCYASMSGFDTETPYTYDNAVADLLAGRRI